MMPEFSYPQYTLYDALDGLKAWDHGCRDSGINDDVLRAAVKAHLDGLSENEFRLVISRYVREYMVSEKALKQGYGIEDVASFLDWLRDAFGIEF